MSGYLLCGAASGSCPGPCADITKIPRQTKAYTGAGGNKKEEEETPQVLRLSSGFRGDGFRDRNDLHGSLGFLVEFDVTVAQGEDGEIAAEADVLARMNVRTALSDDDAASGDELTAVGFDSTHFRFAVAAVTAAGLAFFMCHFRSPNYIRLIFKIQETEY
jgi:hypothetical protein